VRERERERERDIKLTGSILFKRPIQYLNNWFKKYGFMPRITILYHSKEKLGFLYIHKIRFECY
jgi:hypothetical protein